MEYGIRKRDFLGALGLVAGVGLSENAALAQMEHERTKVIHSESANRKIPRRKAKTTPLFKVSSRRGGLQSGWPNCLAPAREGLWIGEQRHDGKPEAAWLMSTDGKLLKTVMTQSKDTSGIAYGDGCIWMGANTDDVNGFFQTDLEGRLIAVHQIPLGPKNNGGSTHGALWHDGKLWIVANRLRSILRVDPSTWQPEYEIPIILPAETPRFHGIAWDNDAIWIVVGNDSKNYQEGRPGIVKLDVASGDVLEIVEFLPGSCDPHGLAVRDGVFYSCDAGEHPGWPIGTNTIQSEHSTKNGNSPFGGYVFRIDMI